MRSPHRVLGLSVSLLAVVALGTGCVSAPRGDDIGVAPQDVERSWVVVENHAFADAAVYVERDGIRFRLGTVAGMATRRFEADRTRFGTAGYFRLIADPVGSSATNATHSMHLIPGATVVWRLEQAKEMSTVVIR